MLSSSASGRWGRVYTSGKRRHRRYGVSDTTMFLVLAGLAMVYALSYGEFFRGGTDRALWATKAILASIGAAVVIANPTRRIAVLRLAVVAVSATLPLLFYPHVTSFDADLLIMLCVSICATMVPLDAAVVACVTGWIAGATVVVATWFLGLVPQRVVVLSDRVRYYCGFYNPNGFGIVAFVVACCVYLLLRRRRGASLVLVAGGVIIWFVSASRTSIVALGAAAGLDLITRSKMGRNKAFASGVAVVASLIGWTGFLGQIASPWLMAKWPAVNALLSNRVEQWSAFVKLSGWRITLSGGAVGQFDGGYLQVYGAFGLLFLVVFLTLVLLGVRRLSMHGQWPVVCVVLGWLIYSCGENVFLAPGFFPAVLAWGIVIGRRDWVSA